jgi:endogenous inhibitor of DNA gyrase (YacG/DUF329 family)
MIDEERTMELFGYTSDELRPKSAKPIIAVCDDCGMYRNVAKYGYRDLCMPCSKSGSNNSLWKPRLKMICLQCGKTFEVKQSKPNTKFCSMKCCGKWNSLNMVGKNGANWRGGKAEVVCEQCGKYFDVFPYNSDARFCSKKCYGQWASLNMVGENSAHWNGGITSWRNMLWYSRPYNAWRGAVFERDGYTCQMCSDFAGGNLQAHHIRPVRDHKNDLLVFDVDNGITLCKDCHESICGREHSYINLFTNIIEERRKQ